MTSNVSHKLAKSRLQPVAVRHLRRKRLDLILFIVICRLYSYFNVAAVLSNTLCCLSTSKCGLTLMIADSNNSDILSIMLLNSLKQLTHTRAQWHPVLQIFYLLFKLKEKKTIRNIKMVITQSRTVSSTVITWVNYFSWQGRNKEPRTIIKDFLKLNPSSMCHVPDNNNMLTGIDYWKQICQQLQSLHSEAVQSSASHLHKDSLTD